MESLKQFTDRIKKFYELIESHESEIQNCLEETKKPLQSINNQSIFFRVVVPKDSLENTPFVRVERFKEDLSENIFTSLQEEYFILEQIRKKINTANEVLRKEQLKIETSYTNLKSGNSVDFSSLNPCCPSFEHIIDWCHDIWRHYHSYYLQISHALMNLNYGDENTVIALSKCFKENSELKKHVKKIRNFRFSEFQFLT